ncbi:hypothetical protein FLACOL_00075 [Flavobacterium columnare]|uniref:Uncharacterized protein n=1 Tax=Flavobacterium columnare TaxID=996 RepID=A0A2N9P6W2_9FLAO|nr:hypothetical protein FLACOL_00075 [Flavobacterium columnare]
MPEPLLTGFDDFTLTTTPFPKFCVASVELMRVQVPVGAGIHRPSCVSRIPSLSLSKSTESYIPSLSTSLIITVAVAVVQFAGTAPI